MTDETKMPPDDPKPREMYLSLMARTDRLIGVQRTIAAVTEEALSAGVPPDVVMRLGTKLLSRAKELSK